jgi:YVTN family beta-propeller protein
LLFGIQKLAFKRGGFSSCAPVLSTGAVPPPRLPRAYDGYVRASFRRFTVFLLCGAAAAAESYVAPAGIRPALRRAESSVLPGGRVISPLGDQYVTGSGSFGLAVSASGRTVVVSNGGPSRNSLTILERQRDSRWEVRQLVSSQRDSGAGEAEDSDGNDWKGVFMGLAFANEHAVFASEGNSGRISLIDWSTDRRRTIDINGKGFEDSYTGDLAIDPERGLLYAVDQANFRVAIIDIRSRQVLSSVRVGRLPFALALSPDGRKLYVANLGMFEYRAIPGADAAQAAATGLPFPAFGFPSEEAAAGADRDTARGTVRVPGLGDPNAIESNCLSVVDVSNPDAPKLEASIRTGRPFGDGSNSGSSPSGVAVAGSRVFVANAGNDSITVIDAATNRVEAEIPIRIPGLERLRGVLPIGLAWHEKSGRLLVAEAGINALAVIDPETKRVEGHIPVGWFPTRVSVHGGEVFVTNARGRGAGPNGWTAASLGPAQERHGSVSVFPLPPAAELAGHTGFVMEANGFRPRRDPEPPLPAAIRHVVLIVKENRTYDEVLGDVWGASNGPAMGAPQLARFGTRGNVDGRGLRFSLKDVNVTPNHHAIARRWSFGDNFYADSDVSVDGHHWLVGSYPNAWTESSLLAAYSGQKKDFRLGAAPGRLLFAASNSSVHPEDQVEGGTIWHHLARHGIPFYNFGEGFELAGVDEGPGLEPTGARFLTNVPMPDPLYRNTSREYPGFNMNIPDQYRATRFIGEIERRYVRAGADLPAFLFLHLPNDHMAKARPEDGYPYEESFVADNDYALGRILEYLSGTKWWRNMAVFITEDDAQGGIDHIDAHRTVLLGAGPWFRKDYVSHVNASFPGLLKTIFRLLGVPPLNLFDASASDLSDCFASRPDPAPYRAAEVDKRIFDPAEGHPAPAGTPSPRMDDPSQMRGLPRR